MKKVLFLLAGAATILAGCSKTEVVKQPTSMAIQFGKAYIGNSVESRAVTENTTTSLTTFQVFGQYDNTGTVKVFENVPVTTTDNGSTWTYTGGQRTWMNGMTYVFAAYAPAAALATPTVTGNGYLNIGAYTSDAANQYDLIYATQQATGKDQGNAPVAFTFKHLLSWVRLSLVNAFSDEYTVTVSNIKIAGILPTNTFTPAEVVTSIGQNGGTWTTASGEATTFTFADTSGEEIASLATNQYDMVVVPQNIGTVTVTFDVSVYEIATQTTVTKSMTATLPVDPTNEWTMGNRYNYKAIIDFKAIDLEVIEFTATVDTWTDQEIGITVTEQPLP